MSFELGVTLTAARLRLRPYREGDVNDVLEASKDPEMLRWMIWATQPPEQAREFCTRIAHEAPEQKICFAVEVDGRCSGSVALQRADWSTDKCEIGYWIAPWARGHGYASEAVRMSVTYGFGRGLRRVELLAATGNTASQKVAERTGFVREGVLRQALVLPDGRADAVVYGLLEGELR